MSEYQLIFGGTQLGDELVVGLGSWRRTAIATMTGGTESMVRLDDQPLGIAIYPKFRLRKTACDAWAFERWVFDLLSWADGQCRRLMVIAPLYDLVADYGEGKLLSLKRPDPTGPFAGRESDQVILTFQTDTQPFFAQRS